jgi:hypothetical protein
VRSGAFVRPAYAGSRDDGKSLLYAIHIFASDLSSAFVTAIDLEDTSGSQEAIGTCQRNFVAFAARLTQSGLIDRSKDFSIPNFRAAFEEEPDQRSKAYLKQGPRLDVYVPLAGIWILCGSVIFTHCRNSETTAGGKDGGEN